MRTYGITTSIPEKTAAGAALAFLGPKAAMALAFGALIFLDCFTRLTALSHQRLAERGEAEGLLAAIRGIPAARRDGRIVSAVMRKRGVEKLILYNLVLLTASLVDFLSGDGLLLPLATAYLSMTEALSIVENLADAGVPGMAELRKRMGKR